MKLEIGYTDVFVTTENHPQAVSVIHSALNSIGLPYDDGLLPMRGPEDSSHFGGERQSGDHAAWRG